jgi:hypothetical protein
MANDNWDVEEGVEKFGPEYARALIKSQRNVINALMSEIDGIKKAHKREKASFEEENRQLRITLGMLDAISIKAEEERMRREGVIPYAE